MKKSHLFQYYNWFVNAINCVISCLTSDWLTLRYTIESTNWTYRVSASTKMNPELTKWTKWHLGMTHRKKHASCLQTTEWRITTKSQRIISPLPDKKKT
jgi:hypothetical protein